MIQVSDISIAKAYLNVKKFLYESGYFNEIEWQYGVDVSRINEQSFLEEYAWVVLNSGMSEKIIRNIFPYICSSFFNWSSIEKIVKNRDLCRAKALKHFNNKKKVDAIIETTNIIYKKKFNIFFDEIKNNGVNYLEKLPYIGPITSYHLAKNIGFSVSKPDRHLVKLAELLNYDSVNNLCNTIYYLTEEPINVIDIVLWRYSTLKKDFYDICVKFDE